MIEKLNEHITSSDLIGIMEIIAKINEIIDVVNSNSNNKAELINKSVADVVYDTCVVNDEGSLSSCVNNLHMHINTKCPHCGQSYYTELYSCSTALYYPPVYKDGVNINPDRNQTTTLCKCLNCGKEFST